MRLLLDTHVALWWATGSDDLSARAIEHLNNPANTNLFSVASAWEIATKYEMGRLRIPQSPAELLGRLTKELELAIIPIEVSHAFMSAALPWHHRDPFDRLLIAQALVLGVPILTSDKGIARYSVPVLW